MCSEFDPYAVWLGVPPGRRPPNHYAILGVDPSTEQREIELAFERACEQLHIYTKGAKSEVATCVLSEVSLAYRTLTNPRKKQEYDASLATVIEHQPAPLVSRSPASGSGADDPWVNVAALLQRYHDEADDSLLREAEQLAITASPADGLLHLARCALELGLDNTRFRSTLDSYAARQNAGICQFCYAFIPNPDPSPMMRVFANNNELRSDAYSISIHEGMVTTTTITGHDTPWAASQPEPSLTKLAAAVAASILVAVISLPFWCVTVGQAGMMAIVAAVSILAISVVAPLTYKFYRPPLSLTIDVAWSELVPVLARSEPSPASAAFISGLAVTSEGKGDPRSRQEFVDLAIRTLRAWARAGVIRRDPLANVYRLSIVDRRKKRLSSHDPIEPLCELWPLCLEGEYSLKLLNHVTHSGRMLHLLSHKDLAIARLRILRIAYEHRLSVADISALRRKSRVVDELLSLGAEFSDKGVAQLFAVINPQKWRGLQELPTTAFVLAAGNRQALLEKWPDLILYNARPEIILCSRGIYFKGVWITKPPTIQRDTDAQASLVNVDGKSFSAQDVGKTVLAKFAEFCEFCFGILEAKATLQLERHPSPNIDDVVFSEAVQCPSCGTTPSIRNEHR